MKGSEIRNLTVPEIENKVLGLKEQMFKINAEASTGLVERPNRLRDIKKDIARCYTILKEKSSEK